MSMEVDEEESSPMMSVTNEPIQHAGIYDRSMVQDHVSIHIENMLHGVPATSPEHSIFRVYHQLREVNEKAYKPLILAIGPYHYGNDKFKFMEEQKLQHLKQLLKRRKEGSVDRYMQTLRELEQRARNCYAETIDLSKEKFLAMMLIDGCFIVELFRKDNMKIPTDRDDPLMESDWLRYYLRRDLLLLENQLPLFVLSKLYDLTKGPDEHREFSEVAAMYFNFELGGPSQNWTIGKREHLLHLYHAWCTSGLPKMPELNYIQVFDQKKKNYIQVMPSAIKLIELGVRFRAVHGGQLSDIKFENGTLHIPVLEVDNGTESKFRNLIAYEQHRQKRDINYFTDYMYFMDCLINSSEDIELLRCCGIIKTYLGDDKVVVQIFNKMCDCVIVSSPYFYHSKIFHNVNAHCGKRMNIWMKNLKRQFINSPWGALAILSVLAAIGLLLLTVAQTVFTILSYTK